MVRCAPHVTMFIQTADGRQLAVRESGNPAGHPVFVLHGTPGSRVGPHPSAMHLYKMGIRLISYDRPGYGESDRHPARRVADVAQDVEAIADFLGIEEFAVFGRSGGGPHALACSAALPKRVTKAAVLVSLAPRAAEGLDWFAGMADSNVRQYTAAVTQPTALIAELMEAAARIRADPDVHVATIGPEMPEADRRVVADPGIRTLLAQNFAAALRHSAAGWIDDAMAFSAPWGFDPSDIQVPVLLWHGADDVFTPVGHTMWLAERIPGAIVAIRSGSAHFGALEVMLRVLSWLIRPD